MEQPPHRHGLVDTDILIDASRGIDQAGEFLNEIKRHVGISVSVISAMELVAGCKDSAQLRQTKSFLEQVAVFPLSEPISSRAQNLMETYTLSHGLLIPDALVAASAIEAGLALYTRNTRHFRMIPEILIIQPY